MTRQRLQKQQPNTLTYVHTLYPNHLILPRINNQTLIADSSQRYARVELQTLTRLPKTRSILFSFKTYLYPLSDIKDEGLGHDLADAIEGLGNGNAPDMRIYKGSTSWAAPVCEYLRS